MTSRVIIVLLIVLAFCSCHAFKNVPSAIDKAEDAPTIVFHELLAVNNNNIVTIEEISSSTANGSMKQSGISKENFNNPVDLHFLDKSGKRIFSSWIEHPLINIYEYSSPEGELGKKTVVNDSAIFYIRYNYKPGISSLSFISSK